MADPSVDIQFFGLGVTICVVLAFLRYGWDVHVWDLTDDDLIAGRQVSFAAQAMFISATALAKASILVSYLRLAPANSWFRRMTSESGYSPAPHFKLFAASNRNPSRQYLVYHAAEHRLLCCPLHPVHVRFWTQLTLAAEHKLTEPLPFSVPSRATGTSLRTRATACSSPGRC